MTDQTPQTDWTSRHSIIIAVAAFNGRLFREAQAAIETIEWKAAKAQARAEGHFDGDGCDCYNRGYDHGLTAGERR